MLKPINKLTKRYRFFEMIPGMVAWITITFPLWGSFIFPQAVAFFVIAFLVYWLYQSIKNVILSLMGYYKIQAAKKIDWYKKYNESTEQDKLAWKKITNVIFIVSYKEPVEIIDMALGSLSSQENLDLKQLHVVLAQEDRAGKENNQKTIEYFQNKYKNVFGHLESIEHPFGIEGETVGKHSNEAWAAVKFKEKYLDTGKYNIDHLTLTSCDVDTIFNPNYFSALTYSFAVSTQRYVRFWQAPIFWHSNINKVPAFIRIIGTIGNILHIANIQEPDGLFFNYSCYSSSYKLIDSAGYWDVDMIPEDWHIFLQSFFASGGQARVEPIFLPTIVDAPTGNSYFSALKNRYQQCLRHAWGAVDIAYTIEKSRVHTEIPLSLRLARIFKLLQTHAIWSSNWFILTLGTSLPLLLNPSFFQTTIGYNLPRLANVILTICLIPLFVLIILDWKLRPKSAKTGLKVMLLNLLQWPLMPIATLVMSTLPGLESHTRLMLGKRIEYKTTIKK